MGDKLFLWTTVILAALLVILIVHNYRKSNKDDNKIKVELDVKFHPSFGKAWSRMGKELEKSRNERKAKKAAKMGDVDTSPNDSVIVSPQDQVQVIGSLPETYDNMNYEQYTGGF